MMKQPPPEYASQLVGDLKNKISPYLSDSLNQSQFFVDVADAYSACSSFISLVDDLLSKDIVLADQVEVFLADLDVHLLEHLAYHIKSLRRLIPDE
ncbi:MAG: hypothetical protein LBE62_15615 [Azonexus sp.]|jgi:hypothetical protein|nr:hypothetical protein [Azonexus sp.]